MIVVCAWCGENLGDKEPIDFPLKTHGICEECKAAMLAGPDSQGDEGFQQGQYFHHQRERA